MEQLCRWILAGKRGVNRMRKGSYERYLKRQAVRWLRRLGKQLADDAPRKLRFRGYSD